jgi:hypothetical protein
MPYIKQEDREKFENSLNLLKKDICSDDSKGELTYILYSISLEWIKKKGKSYTSISSGISSLIDAAEELRRRELNPYEDVKLKENGDIDE